MSDIELLTNKLKEFRDQRDWQQFHDSKNLALAISIEAAELNELFLWKNSPDEIASVSQERISEELADILAFALLMADENDLNIVEIVTHKIKKNAKKYPIDQSKGRSTKYNEL